MYSEDQLLPISALQHLIFCERQCALIHVERLWAENRWTVEGRHLHDKAHTATAQNVAGIRIARGLRLHSYSLGLFGQADVVELETVERPESRVESQNQRVEGLESRQKVKGLESRVQSQQQGRVESPESRAEGQSWDVESSRLSALDSRRLRVTPIEYKRGKPKKDDSDRVQLCAQAICLEEMLGQTIATGQLFYGKRKRRTEVHLDTGLRELTKQKALRLHQMIADRETPTAVREPKCDQCSLLHLCLPDALRFKTGASAFVSRSLAAHLSSNAPETDDFNFVTADD